MRVAKTTVTVEKKSLATVTISPVTNPDEYIHSSLIHEVYLNNDLKNDFPKFWGKTAFEEGGFGYFFQNIKELVTELKSISGKKLDHSQTVTEVINPVLAALGWNSPKEMLLGNNLIVTNKSGDEISIKPTYTLFSNEEDAKSFSKHYKSSSKPNDQFNFIPVATSYFGAWADQKSSKYDKTREQHGKFGDIFSALGTDEQAYNYADILSAEWCFSTDGHSWRLIKKSAFAVDHNKYFEFNFWGILNALSTAKPHEEDALAEILKSFYWFFSKESHLLSKPNQISLTWERAKKYTDNLEDDLRARFVAAMSIAVNSLWKSAKKNQLDIELNHIQDIAESLIYNVLFIRSCESRRILPLHQSYMPVSIHNLLAKLRDFQPTDESFSETTQLRLGTLFKTELEDGGNEIFDYLLNLFEMTNDSEKKSKTFGFAIEGFKENIFSNREWTTLKKIKIENLDFAKVLSTLFFIEQGVQVPFNVLTPQQFGSIFESFLEYKLDSVKSMQCLIKRKNKTGFDVLWAEKVRDSDQVVYVAKRGSLWFRADNTERKVSGSYYTPDYLVDYIVEKTLAPAVVNLSAKEILEFKVCDPAMGSGHFLISALRLLTKEYIKKLSVQDEAMAFYKRMVLHSCIFGIDINPRSIKLGKLSLWLETAEAGKVLEHLDDQLKCADSISTEQIWQSGKVKSAAYFDAIVGNPPYIGEATAPDLFRNLAQTEIGKRFYKAKSDYFYYFIHRGIDWLKEGGRLGFINTNYFISASGAVNLRLDMTTRAAVQCLVNFNSAKLFKDAPGQHNMIEILEKRDHRVHADQTIEIFNIKIDGFLDGDQFAKEVENPKNIVKIKQTDLVEGDKNYFNLDKHFAGNSLGFNIDLINKLPLKLTDVFKISQGLKSNLDRIAKSHIDNYKKEKIVAGEGVFRLTEEEVKNLGLSKTEMRFVKPLFKSSDISRYFAKNKPDDFILYISNQHYLDFKTDRNLVGHLKRFEKLLVNRDGVEPKGSVKIYAITRPRELEMFTSPKIAVPYRSNDVRFAYIEKPWFASTDVYYIAPKSKKAEYSLKVLTCLLNSAVYQAWFNSYGRKKGNMFEFSAEPLSLIRIPKLGLGDIQSIEESFDLAVAKNSYSELEELVDKILKANFGSKSKRGEI